MDQVIWPEGKRSTNDDAVAGLEDIRLEHIALVHSAASGLDDAWMVLKQAEEEAFGKGDYDEDTMVEAMAAAIEAEGLDEDQVVEASQRKYALGNAAVRCSTERAASIADLPGVFWTRPRG